MKTTPTTGGEAPGAAAELPTVAFRRFSHITGWNIWEQEGLLPGSAVAEGLTPRAPAQAQLDALREEVARLTKERVQLTFAMGAWKELFWAVARELNCLPSTFWDGNAHVLKAAIKLNAELAAFKAHPTDVDALMALADEWTTLERRYERGNASSEACDAAREALRAKLAARKEEREPMTPDEIHDRITELKDLLP